MDRASVDTLLTTTRAVRKRLDLDKPVPDQVINECLELAIQAPTGSNAQGWRWVVVTDPDKRKMVAEAYRKGWATYPKTSDDPQTQRVISSADYLADVMERVPVHVIPCLMGRLPPGMPESLWAGFLGSIYPAVWSFQLALRSRGLGSALTTLHLGAADEVAEALGIPNNVTQTCLLPVAYTKGTGFKPAKRRPVAEITYWNAWSQTR